MSVEEKPGKVRHLEGARYFFRPSLNRVLIRKSGVTRRSDAVRKRNDAFKAWVAGKDGAVVKCRGQKWEDFVKCLRNSARATLGPGKSKEAEYRKKFWLVKE